MPQSTIKTWSIRASIHTNHKELHSKVCVYTELTKNTKNGQAHKRSHDQNVLTRARTHMDETVNNIEDITS